MDDSPNGGKRPFEQEDDSLKQKEKRGNERNAEDENRPSFVSRLFGQFGIRRYYSTGERVDKEYWQKLSLEEKRNHYKCGKGYLTLDKIKKWPEFYEHTRSTIKPPEGPNRYSVNEILNNMISVHQGDITKLEIDGIVNAANSSLMGGGGVDGAIHSAAGNSLRDECYDLGGCDTGQTKITTGHRLPAKYILHTVGPLNGSGALLKSCYNTCFELVKQHHLRSVAFCCIATGVYGFPNDKAANIALNVTRQWLETDNNHELVDRIIFVVFLKNDYKLYTRLLQEYFPLEDSDVGGVATPPNDGVESEGEEESSLRIPALQKSVTAPVHVVNRKMKKDDKMEDKDVICKDNIMEVIEDDGDGNDKETVAMKTDAMETDKETVVDSESESNVLKTTDIVNDGTTKSPPVNDTTTNSTVNDSPSTTDSTVNDSPSTTDSTVNDTPSTTDSTVNDSPSTTDSTVNDSPSTTDSTVNDSPSTTDSTVNDTPSTTDSTTANDSPSTTDDIVNDTTIATTTVNDSPAVNDSTPVSDGSELV